jgi:hypothetical protein
MPNSSTPPVVDESPFRCTAGEIIGLGLLRAILAQAGVTGEEFRAAL